MPSNEIKFGEPARLIPVVSDMNREQRIASVTLAIVSHVPDLARCLFGSLGVRLGKRYDIQAYTEVVFPGKAAQNSRPDALVVVSTGRNVWKALVEAKVGKATLSEEQVGRYVELAKDHNIDAVITLSNEFTARVDHHPTLTLKKTTARKVGLYHWPWAWILTQAKLLQIDKEPEDREQKFLLDEFCRYAEHPNVGIEAFSQMPKAWKNVVTDVRNNTSLRKTAPDVEAVVSAWQQEIRDLALRMSTHIGRRVDLKLSRKHKDKPSEWLKDGCAELAAETKLSCALQIPDTAGDLNVCADLKRRSVDCSVRMVAPRDKKSTKARVNWLVRQVKPDSAAYEELIVWAIRPGNARNTHGRLADLKETPELLELSASDTAPTAFEVVLSRDLAGSFSASRKFIEEFERIVPAFYDAAMQYLKAWQASPPKPVKETRKGSAGTKNGSAQHSDEGANAYTSSEDSRAESA